MAIRVREIDGTMVALCAAISEPRPGDIYLDDAIHEALVTKIHLDAASMGIMDDPPVDTRKIPLMQQEQGGRIT